jgi:splicing factor 3B subunit 2
LSVNFQHQMSFVSIFTYKSSIYFSPPAAHTIFEFRLLLCREQQAAKAAEPKPTVTKPKKKADDIDIEYVTAPLDVVLAEALPSAGDGGEEDAATLQEFNRILQRFNGEDEEEENGAGGDKVEGGAGEEEEAEKDSKKKKKVETDVNIDKDEEADDDDEDMNEEAAALSKKKRKEAARLKIAELKQLSDRPEVVEVWDVSSTDPGLLVHLKSYRNTVPVPRHWSQKRKYLQGKRGLEKPPFQLPAFIEATGIGEMRQAYLEKADAKNMKSKGRERMAPKMGKLDIDYQILHDAFFRHQTKPNLTGHGDLYYEGKEYESTMKHARPGSLSSELQEALDMHPGTPPPWLVSMQRYGPPPSYPSLRIPGLNAPIPLGAHYGYHPGGWGKPPVDEYGNPIYGDVFNQGGTGGGINGGGIDKDEEFKPQAVSHWGALEEESEEESEEEESEDDDESAEDEEEGDEAAAFADGTASTISGIASTIPGGLETPVEVQLRKQQEEHAARAPEAQQQLYQVLEEQKAGVGAAGIMGSDHVYVVPGTTGDKKLSITATKRMEALRREMPSDVEIAIDPADLEALDDEALKDLYEMRMKEARVAAGREHPSDLVAAKAANQKRKASDSTGKGGGGAGGGGKEKKFKF